MLESDGEEAKPHKTPQNQRLPLEGHPDLSESGFRMGKFRDFGPDSQGMFRIVSMGNRTGMIEISFIPIPATKPRPGILFQTEIPALALGRERKKPG